MVNFILRVYTRFKIILWNFKILCKIYAFSIYLFNERILHNGDPEDILKVLQKFVELAWTEYPEGRVMNRTPYQSALLLGVLIKKYIKSGSNIILDQIIEVLKNEFIKRGSSGGK